MVRQHHPQMGETEIRLYLNQALQLLAFRSDGVYDDIMGKSTIGQRDYDSTELGANILKIDSVYLADSEDTLYKIPRLIGSVEIEED